MSENTTNTGLAKAYEPKEIEEYWSNLWVDKACFSPQKEKDDSREAYCIVSPPPNVTGNLHIGHALNMTLQDLLCRHARQLNKQVLWVVGTDHAGIATQNVVERRLALEGKTRDDLGREAFIERVWSWKDEYNSNIHTQIKALGASVDWTRERFTMDEGLSAAVRRVFVQLYNEECIYRGAYIINWCVRCHTALADDEVEFSPQKTHLWHVRYYLEDGRFLSIATTRPETILGDSAVCVHPEDARYTDFVGKKVRVPLTDRWIPIIADNYVDQEFGTGALKVTPSHDHNDWTLGKKHALEFIQVMDEFGCMNELAGAYAGLKKEDARAKIVADLEAQGLLERVEDYENNVGCCYRCQTIIEPYVSTQWFVSVKGLAAKARAAVPSETRIIPESWEKTYFNWLDSIRDWCISRQIWWGHRIPAWTCSSCNKLVVVENAPDVCPHCNSTELVQEEDVLDTWFSSALWPFSTLGWPEKSWELERFYPTSVLVTGFDILFFWVARMMMMGIHFMGKVPFHDVYIHALVRDAEGRKMSKSTGNVINPLDMIAKYGADTLRFTLISFAAMGRDIRLSEERIEGYRHFMNKIWNATRFALLHLDAQAVPKEVPLDESLALHHRWILHQIEEVKRFQKTSLAEYRFNDAAQSMYRFVWNSFCDWYLELIKQDLQKEGKEKEQALYVLWLVLQETCVLLHPYVPFISSEIWTVLPKKVGSEDNLSLCLFPEERAACYAPEVARRMELVQELIVAVRTIRAELNISPSARLQVLVRPKDAADLELITSSTHLISSLARLESLSCKESLDVPKTSASQVVQGNEIIVLLEGNVDFSAELVRIDKELAKLTKEKDSLAKKLSNEQFLAKAPKEVVEKDTARLEESKLAISKLESLRERFVAVLEQ